MTEFTIAPHVSGNTFMGLNFIVSNELGVIDISDALIEFIPNRDSSNTLSTEDNAIIITDGPAGECSIVEQLISWEPATYEVRLTGTLPNGRKRTWGVANWTII